MLVIQNRTQRKRERSIITERKREYNWEKKERSIRKIYVINKKFFSVNLFLISYLWQSNAYFSVKSLNILSV